ncbi:MAG: hypothetical protein FJW39_01410 [Acidobacteria bacterium]|nr:hypothetical protein [Acidobacteriota bacterium]
MPSKLTLCLLIAFTISCTAPAPQDPRQQLTQSLRGVDVAGYNFSMQEDESQSVASLTNGAVRKLITLEPATQSVTLKYASTKDLKTNAVRITRTEAVRAESGLELRATDIASGEILVRHRFPQVDHTPTPPQPTFDSLEQCIADFHCKQGATLLCEANRTCQTQFAGITCRLKSGDTFSVHLIIQPTAPRCTLAGLMADFEGLVLSRR